MLSQFTNMFELGWVGSAIGIIGIILAIIFYLRSR
jgi:hypothetical protein